MSISEINFEVELDEDNVPESITWNATDKPGDKESTKAVSIAVWDPAEKNTMRIDLWTKDMPRNEMRGFYINALAGMAESVQAATGDEEMAKAIIEVCERFCK